MPYEPVKFETLRVFGIPASCEKCPRALGRVAVMKRVVNALKPYDDRSSDIGSRPGQGGVRITNKRIAELSGANPDFAGLLKRHEDLWRVNDQVTAQCGLNGGATERFLPSQGITELTCALDGSKHRIAH